MAAFGTTIDVLTARAAMEILPTNIASILA
jgi:hypothetical protein